MLNLREKIVRKWRGWGVIRALDRAIRICVFFAQHSVEKCSGKLWEWRFVIAPPTPFVNLLDATEGGIPVCRAFRVDGSH